MGLVAEKRNTEKKQLTLPKKGPRPAILTGLIDIGVHVRFYQGAPKKPAREFIPLFTLTSDTYEDEEGNKKNMRLSPFPIKLLPGTERGHYAEFVAALDPENEILDGGAGDLTQLIGRKCFVTVVHKDPDEDGMVYANMRGVSAIPEDYPLPDLEFEPIIFDCDNPDREVFEGLTSFVRDQIRGQQNYAGSKLEAILEGEGAPASSSEAPAEDQTDDDVDDDSPY